MLLTPQIIETPAHCDAGIHISASTDYVVPGLPVTRLPKPRAVPLHRVNARTFALEAPRNPRLPTPKHPLVLHYGFNRWKLSGSDMAKLYALPIGDYRVTGYASPPGTAAYNQNLSTHRAKAAAGFLRMLGSHAAYSGKGVPAGAQCAPSVLPQNCRPGLRESKVVVTRLSPQSVEMRIIPVEAPGPVLPDLSAHPLPLVQNTVLRVPAHSFFAALKTDKALWATLVVHPGDLRDVAAQVGRATGYRVEVTGVPVALHDMGMPWNKPAPAAVVLHKLHRQPWLQVRVVPGTRLIHIRVDLGE